MSEAMRKLRTHIVTELTKQDLRSLAYSTDDNVLAWAEKVGDLAADCRQQEAEDEWTVWDIARKGPQIVPASSHYDRPVDVRYRDGTTATFAKAQDVEWSGTDIAAWRFSKRVQR
jgi:hypothetical protein